MNTVQYLLLALLIAVVHSQQFVNLVPGTVQATTLSSTGSAFYLKADLKSSANIKYLKPLFQACTGAISVYIRYCWEANCDDSKYVPSPNKYDFYSTNTGSWFTLMCLDTSGKCRNNIVYYIALVAAEANTQVKAAISSFVDNQGGDYGYGLPSNKINVDDGGKVAFKHVVWCDDEKCDTPSEITDATYQVFVQANGKTNYNMGASCGATLASAASPEKPNVYTLDLYEKPTEGKYVYNVVAKFTKNGQDYQIPYVPMIVTKSGGGSDSGVGVEAILSIMLGLGGAFLLAVVVTIIVVVVLVRRRNSGSYSQF
jgi:hypothetical protein